MDIKLETKRKFIEASYLSAENAYRYRVILRIAYSQYEKMKFWMYKEEIFNLIKDVEGFKDYTLENLKQDLDSLEAWGNFITIQDSNRVKTLEEFKNRKFRYQISPNTIELERTLIMLEKVKESSRGSLEISLMERFNMTLEKIKTIDLNENKEIFSWWDILNKDFKILNENYQDYISKFYSPRTEELLKTTEFLMFKESFIRYLREFVKGIQINMPNIVYIFNHIDNELIHLLIEKLVEYEKNTIALGSEYDVEEETEFYYGKYINMKEWFVGSSKSISMVESLLNNTNEIIRKITRYALQIIEMQTSGGSRKEEYKTLIKIFNKCENIEEAHRLSSVVFGTMSSRHVIYTNERETESINSGIFDENPDIVVVKPSNRYREKTASRTCVRDKSSKKREMAKDIIKKRNEEKNILESKIKNNRLIFKDLHGITQKERSIFLRWLSAGLNKKNIWVKNEFGRYYKVVKSDEEENIHIRCEDGDFYMPAYELIFKDWEGRYNEIH